MELEVPKLTALTVTVVDNIPVFVVENVNVPVTGVFEVGLIIGGLANPVNTQFPMVLLFNVEVAVIELINLELQFPEFKDKPKDPDKVLWLLTILAGKPDDWFTRQVGFAWALTAPTDNAAKVSNAKSENNFANFILCCNSAITWVFKYFYIKRTRFLCFYIIFSKVYLLWE